MRKRWQHTNLLVRYGLGTVSAEDLIITLLNSLLIAHKRYNEAVLACRRLLELNPTNTDIYMKYGFALHKLTRYEEAIVWYKCFLIHKKMKCHRSICERLHPLGSPTSTTLLVLDSSHSLISRVDSSLRGAGAWTAKTNTL